jgi:hypothetical protein
VKVGDRVLTEQGPGEIVRLWHETYFTPPWRRVSYVVELDDGGWRKIYLLHELELEKEPA